MSISIRDNWSDQTTIGGNSEADVDVVVSTNAVAVPAAVHCGHFAKRKSASLHNEIVDADFGRVVGDLDLSGAQSNNCIHADVDGEVEVMNSLLGLHQTMGDDFAHAGVGNIGVRACGAGRRNLCRGNSSCA